VHREVYGDAAEYFNPYSAAEMSCAIGRLVNAEARSRRADLVALGTHVAGRYLPEKILPDWHNFLRAIAANTEIP